MKKDEFSNRLGLCLLLLPPLVGLVCCVGVTILAPTDERTQGLWALTPLGFIPAACYLNDTRKRALEKASTWLYCGVTLYFALLLLTVWIAEMFGSAR
jgi:hypothetical protein